MKKNVFFLAALFAASVVNAQIVGTAGAKISGFNTSISTTYTTIGSAQTFVEGQKFQVNTSQKTVINAPYLDVSGLATTFNQSGTTTTITKNGIATAGTVTAAKMYTQGLDVGNEIINLKDANVLNTASINNLKNTKADKTQVASDIAKAKSEAIATSNTYTDTKTAEAVSTSKSYTDLETLRAKNAENALGDRIDKESERAKAAESRLNDDLFNESNRAKLSEKALFNEISGVAAMSAAMSAAQGSQIFDPNKRGNFSVAGGFYGNARAVAAGFSYFVSSNFRVSATMSSGMGGHAKAAAAGVGFSIGF